MTSKFEPVVKFIDCFDGNLSKAAAAIQVAGATLSEWRDRARPVPVKKAVLMEQVTSGRVKRVDFFPLDAAQIWPEQAASLKLVAHDAGAPSLYLRRVLKS